MSKVTLSDEGVTVFSIEITDDQYKTSFAKNIYLLEVRIIYKIGNSITVAKTDTAISSVSTINST